MTKVILRVVDHDRPLSAVLRGLINEVNAPRAQTRGKTSTLRPARVRAVPPRPGRIRHWGRHSAVAELNVGAHNEQPRLVAAADHRALHRGG